MKLQFRWVRSFDPMSRCSLTLILDKSIKAMGICNSQTAKARRQLPSLIDECSNKESTAPNHNQKKQPDYSLQLRGEKDLAFWINWKMG